MPNSTPCGWDPLYGDCDQSALERLEADQRQAVIDMAVELLWAWTGRKLGVCDVTVRPCRAQCAPQGSTFWGGRGGPRPGLGWVPVLVGGQWFNIGCGACSSEACSCAPDESRALRLPGIVDSIRSIVIEGEILPETDYQLRDGILYRVDGGVWPSCNDDVASVTEPGTLAWEITYRQGQPVPDSGRMAAGILAVELAKAVCSDKACQLPQRVQSVTRQGVSVAILDSFEDLKDGRTGIWLIDSWVASVNAPRPTIPQVYSPDVPRGRGRGTWQGTGRGRTW